MSTMGQDKKIGKRELLDCTLRDGGYVNDWNFGHDQIVEIFKRLVSSGVEYIEIGFIDERRPFDINRSIFPDTASADRIYAGLDKGNSTVLGMIDYGTCGIENISPADESFIDGIRVIFKEHLVDQALEFCGELKKLGYKVFAQMVSVTTYSDEALKEYAVKCNKIHPYATSMVDSYGLLDGEHLMHIYRILDRYLDKNIKEGFHAHNNFQLGFSNARTFLSCDTDRDILADGTLYGMGKSAGNAPIELLMMYRNEYQGTSYDVDQAIEAIDDVIMDIYRKQYWGYNLFYFLAAEAGCHPNYIRYFQDKQTLSVSQIRVLAHSLKKEKKLLFDEAYARQMYLDYQTVSCDDSKTIEYLSESLKNKKILLMGPGRNVIRQKKKVLSFVNGYDPVIVAVNYIPSYVSPDYIFLTNSRRYTELMNSQNDIEKCDAKIIATSNVTKTDGKFDYVVRYESVIDKDTEIFDNSLVMLLKLLEKLGVSDVALAGFDGYSKRADNYFDVSREYSFAKEKADYLNGYVRKFIGGLESMKTEFVTDSKYETIK